MQHELEQIQAAFELCDGRVFRLRDGHEIIPVTGSGYQVIGALGLTFRPHRVIFALHHGFLPVIVDHIDQNPRNNLISNLRAASPRENGANAKRRFDSRSGATGVVWHCRKRASQARIGVAGQMIYLCSFQSFDEALPPGDHRLEFQAFYTHPGSPGGNAVQNISYDLVIE